MVPRERLWETVSNIFSTSSDGRKMVAQLGPLKIVVLLHPETVNQLLASNSNIAKSNVYK